MSANSSSRGKTAGPSAAKRLQSELRDLSIDDDSRPAGFERIGLVNEDDLFRWEAIMTGPRGTAYEGGRWLLNLTIPSNYPLSPPTIHFTTPITHPNIHPRTGEICLDLLKTSWTPAYTLASTLGAVRMLLDMTADAESPLNVDVASLMRAGDAVGTEALVRFCSGRERYSG